MSSCPEICFQARKCVNSSPTARKIVSWCYLEMDSTSLPITLCFPLNRLRPSKNQAQPASDSSCLPCDYVPCAFMETHTHRGREKE
ncbi:hypothetical protein KP509_03G072900 [Ceratopteris richardii]|uniref:Uncharacterized protein n=1 Tax=Ceratopteris richardii TaxID=49495 RepID=A0A8T2V4J6_CERRI|nr:hypothetical protein KP509_03G072900 [Ceratopteris richardii]